MYEKLHRLPEDVEDVADTADEGNAEDAEGDREPEVIDYRQPVQPDDDY